MQLKDTSSQQTTYPLPLKITLILNPRMTISLIAFGGSSIIFSIYKILNITSDVNIFQIFLYYLFAPVLGVLTLFVPFYQNYLKKAQIIIGDIDISLKLIFRSQIVLWKDVVNIETYILQRQEFLGFITKKNIDFKNKGGFFSSYLSSIGGNYTAIIPLQQLGILDKEKVVLTIKQCFYRKFEKHAASANLDTSNTESSELDIDNRNHPKSNYRKAIIYSIITATIVGNIYLATILILNVNFVIIPLVGSAAIFHFFSKHVLMKDYAVPHRLWIAFLSAYCIILARIGLLYHQLNLVPTFGNFNSIVYEYFFLYLSKNIESEFIVLLTLAFNFIFGYLQGPTIYLIKRFNALFMRKAGIIPYKKNRLYYTFYFIPPADYNEIEEKIQYTITFGCQIEIKNKRPVYFKLPYDGIQEFNIKFPHKFCRLSMDRAFLEIPLGGTGLAKNYVYDAVLICNTNSEIELLLIEFH